MIPTTPAPLAVRLRLWAVAAFGPGGQPPRAHRDGVPGVSEGAGVPTSIVVTGGKGKTRERHVVVIARFEGTLLRPRDAVRLSRLLIAQAAREVVGL
ncbi:hypothetical protein SEA_LITTLEMUNCHKIN_66 [Gordonia phage LittleMunchkin]|nr:hypothetical protein SEA_LITTLEMUNCHKIN_66 [Gordonia phage LittleMunchkin]